MWTYAYQPTGLSYILFILGLICIIIELFVPGFGFFGVMGILAIGLGSFFASSSIWFALVAMAIALSLLLIILFLLILFFPEGKLKKTLFLTSSTSKEAGFSSNTNLTHLIGQQAFTHTDLHPSGRISIENIIYQAVTKGEYIESEQLVEVIGVSAGQLIVKQLTSKES